MTLSLNDRAAALADRLAGDADAARVAVEHAVQRHARHRLRRAGAAAASRRGGASPRSAWPGSDRVAYAPLVLDGRWLPGAHRDHRPPRGRLPGRAVRGLADRPRRLLRDGQRARARADPRRGPLRRPRLGRAGERGGAVPGDPRARRPWRSPTSSRERAGVAPSALTLLMAPTASIAGGVQIAARVVETALHKLHELDFDVRRVVAGFGSCPLPPVGGDDMEAIGRTNDAVLYGGQVHLTVEAGRRRRAARARRAPAGLGVVGLRRAVRQGPQGRRLRLLQDRSAALQPRADQAHERGERAQLRGRRASTSRCWSARSGADRRDPGVERRLARAAAHRRAGGARPRASRSCP